MAILCCVAQKEASAAQIGYNTKKENMHNINGNQALKISTAIDPY